MALISSSWIFEQDGNLACYWPTYLKSTTQREKTILNHLELKREKCTICTVRIKYSSNNYDEVQDKLKALEEEESSQSEEGERTFSKLETRKQRTTTKQSDYDYSFASDDDEEKIPTAPRPFIIKRSNKTFTDLVSVPPRAELQEINNQDVFKETKNTECCCDKNIKLLSHLVKEIITIKKDVKQLILLSSSSDITEVSFSEVHKCQFYENLVKFDEDLKNEEFFKKCCMNLGLVGGKDYSETTGRVLANIIGHKLSLEINFTGKNNKNGLQSNNNVLSLIKAAVRKNSLARNCTDTAIIHVIMVWLRNASDREGGRTRRNKTNPLGPLGQ